MEIDVADRKGSPYPSFQAYTIGNERTIVAKIQK